MLIQCTDCNKEISKEAKSCVHCGAKNGERSMHPVLQGLLLVLFLGVAFGIISAIQGPPKPEADPAIMTAEESSRTLIQICLDDMSRPSSECQGMIAGFEREYGKRP